MQLEIILSIKKGSSLAKGIWSSDLITIYFGNVVILLSELDSERFHLGFLFAFVMIFCFVFAGLVCHHPLWSPTSVRNLLWGIALCLSWDKDSSPNILMPGGELKALANFRLSICYMWCLKVKQWLKSTLNMIDPQLPPFNTIKIKRVGCFSPL